MIVSKFLFLVAILQFAGGLHGTFVNGQIKIGIAMMLSAAINALLATVKA